MILQFNGKSPKIDLEAFIAPNATIIGNVVVEEGASIWYGAVLRADFNQISVGKNSSVQDNCVIHVDEEKPTVIGDYVTVGHGCVLEGCQVLEGAVIGMNSTILTGSVIGKQALLGAGSLIKVAQNAPARTLAAGVPAKVKKELSGDSVWWVENAWKEYYKLSRQHLNNIYEETE
jgi:carbonic anhydrase/acetyltransferase-like protein (isoleucine patch superfamily)